jgi:hypothetical protein
MTAAVIEDDEIVERLAVVIEEVFQEADLEAARDWLNRARRAFIIVRAVQEMGLIQLGGGGGIIVAARRRSNAKMS